MHEIFISYRRIDTETSGGHLYADLCRSFGAESVFMDRRKTGIRWGADWEKSLNDALASCEVLIALIGPLWATCKRSPNVRRLDAPDDWVRCEIATALEKKKHVLPVLIQGAKPPEETDLPEQLQLLLFHKKQAYPISEHNWDADTQSLVDELAEYPRLRQLHDLATTETGIRLLEQLIRDDVEAADAVSRSRAVIETTDHSVDEIRLLKGIHDALHQIESKCLIPVREAPTDLPLDGFPRKFVQQDHVIRRLLEELATVLPELPGLLEFELPERLSAAEKALEVAVASRDQEDLDRAVGRLEELIGEIPVRLNDAIDRAATRLELQRLLELMATVSNQLRTAADRGNELRPMLDAVDALGGLHAELALRVREHGLFQSLDNFLRVTVGGQRRAGTSGRIKPAALETYWSNIRRLRERFQEPFSYELEEGRHILEALEPGIEEAVQLGDEPKAVARLNEYALEVGDLFRTLDSKLKEFCFALRDRTRPLKTILDMIRVGAHHD